MVSFSTLSMLTIEQCRSLLPTEMQFSDTMVEEIRDSLYTTTELAFEVYWMDSQNGSKNPLGLLDGSRSIDIV